MSVQVHVGEDEEFPFYSVRFRDEHDAGGEDYRPVVAGEVIGEPAGEIAGG
jgi:hypothetical protein